jgi:hypothetical protein
LRYRLDVPLAMMINVERSTVEVESVGRLWIKLQKEIDSYWPSLFPGLLTDYQKPRNLQLGWEMQGLYDEELKKKFPDEF